MNLLALPFYPSKAQQLHRSRCHGYADAVLTPPDRFTPFIVVRPATGQGLDCVIVYDAATDQQVRVIMPSDIAVDVYTDASNDYYIYFGGLITNLNLACGAYYLDVKGQFSEVFTVATSTENLLKVTWSNSADLDGLPYASLGFAQRLYLDAELGARTYPYTEEGQKNGSGAFMALSRTLAKSWSFDTLPIPEFLLDALNSLALHDQVSIGDHAGVLGVKVKSIAQTASACADVAQVEFSEAPVTAGSCAPQLPWEAVDTSTYSPKPWLCGGAGGSQPFWEDTGLKRCITTTQTFGSAEITEDVTPNNCAPGTLGQPIPYTLAAGYYVSTTSQTDADEKAQAYFDATKQSFANANGACIPNSKFVSVNLVQRTGGAWDGTFARTDNGPGDLVLNYGYRWSNDYSDFEGTGTATIADGQTSFTKLIAPPQATAAECWIIDATPSTYTIL